MYASRRPPPSIRPYPPCHSTVRYSPARFSFPASSSASQLLPPIVDCPPPPPRVPTPLALFSLLPALSLGRHHQSLPPTSAAGRKAFGQIPVRGLGDQPTPRARVDLPPAAPTRRPPPRGGGKGYRAPHRPRPPPPPQPSKKQDPGKCWLCYWCGHYRPIPAATRRFLPAFPPSLAYPLPPTVLSSLRVISQRPLFLALWPRPQLPLAPFPPCRPARLLCSFFFSAPFRRTLPARCLLPSSFARPYRGIPHLFSPLQSALPRRRVKTSLRPSLLARPGRTAGFSAEPRPSDPRRSWSWCEVLPLTASHAAGPHLPSSIRSPPPTCNDRRLGETAHCLVEPAPPPLEASRVGHPLKRQAASRAARPKLGWHPRKLV